MDLNADLGEGFPWDDLLLERVTSASVCCGFHAGDPATIARTLATAKKRGVTIGAHPGFDDRDGFGRREKKMGRNDVARLILDQVAALDAIARDQQVTIRFLKPHGALYNQARHDPEIAAGILAAATGMGLPVLGQTGGELHRQSVASRVPFIAEGFADRGYDRDGNLLPRDVPGAILHDPEEIASQIVRLSRDGVQTLCLHGDDPRCVELADLARSTLTEHHIPIQGFLPCR